MTKQVQRRRGTATQHTSFTGAEGELSVNTTNKSVHVHDNVTAGGFEAARADMDNVTSSSILTAAGITATTAELNYVDGVTSSIQTQLDGKAGTASPTFTGTLTTANLTATGTTTLAGASTSADITFGDNDKAIFGAGSDLQIYHDATLGQSRIQDVGTGSLYLQGDGGVVITNSAGTTTSATFASTGATSLSFGGTTKFATTSTGIDVTGTVTADGLTVDGSSAGTLNNVNFLNTNSGATQTANRLGLGITNSAGAAYTYIEANESGVDSFPHLNFYTGSSATKRLEIADNGDISFYEDTGTTAKFFWDASLEALGVGITPATAMHVYQATGNTALRVESAAANSQAQINFKNDARRYNVGINSSDNLVFEDDTAASTRMVIDSSGNVGIGTSSPSDLLHVYKSSNAILKVEEANGYASLQQSGVNSYLNNVASGGSLIFRNGASPTEAMRIDSSGRVMIAETSNSGYSGNADDLIVGDNGSATERGISLGSTSASSIRFNDGSDAGVIEYSHSDNSMRFGTDNGSERMRIDSSGNYAGGDY